MNLVKSLPHSGPFLLRSDQKVILLCSPYGHGRELTEEELDRFWGIRQQQRNWWRKKSLRDRPTML